MEFNKIIAYNNKMYSSSQLCKRAIIMYIFCVCVAAIVAVIFMMIEIPSDFKVGPIEDGFIIWQEPDDITNSTDDIIINSTRIEDCEDADCNEHGFCNNDLTGCDCDAGYSTEDNNRQCVVRGPTQLGALLLQIFLHGCRLY